MASRESKTISGFPRRIFSSLRRSKKSVRLRHNLDGSGPPASFTVEDLDKTQNNNATIDFEATIPLENPNETNRADNNEDSEQSSLLPSPVPSYRVINEDVSVLENIPPELFGNLSTPVVRRFELGGLMSASADSGIDCSLLQSEKNSPEQFVAFTRREAERIRQKQQILGFNESLLEPLNEVDSRSSSDTENIVRSSSELNDDATDCNGASTNENEGENQKDGYLHAHHKDSNCDYVHLSNNSEKCPNESTSTETNLVYPLPKPHTGFKDSGDYVYLLEENLESIHHTDEQSITDSRDQIANDHYEIDLISNKTDETKSAEARLRMHSNSEKSVSIATNPPIVDPIPIRLTNLATQRALVPTPCPDSLFENETSAFAKCKSLKRSVSDAGFKGFFGRFRHRSKDNVSLISEADSLSSHNSLSSREKLKKKVKKFSLKKGKDKLRKRHISDIILHSAAHIADFTYGVDSSKETVKSSDAKELIVSDDAVMSNDRACSRQSTVDKVGQQMIKSDLSRSVSPLQCNSIESFTKSMCKMTSALQSSSTESIACICDCKDRDSKAACCEKRKTPTPPLSVICELTADNLFTSEKCGNYLNSETTGSDHVSQSSRHICCSTKSTKHTVYQNVSGSNKPGSSGVLNDASWFECSDESDDDNSQCSCYSDCDTCTSSQDSSGENDDALDCSNLCIASPETGKLPLNDDDFSDSESYFNEPASNDDSINQDPEEDVMQNELSQFDLNSSIQSFNVSQDIFAKVNSRVNNFSMTRSFNSPMSTSQSGASNNAGISLGPQSSEFSVSFHEVDFENGEVMYMENDLGDGDEFTEETVRPIKAFAHLSHLCATPVSSPRTEASRSVESSVNNYPINRLPSGMSRSSRSHGALNNQFLLSKECVSETNFNMSQDESFTNVSFEGSFAENSFSVHSKHGDARNSQKSHVNQRQDVESLHHSFSSSRRSEKASFHNLTFDEAFSRSVDHDMRLPWLHASFSGLNDSYVLQKGASSNSHLSRSQSAVMSPNGSFMRNNPRYSSFHRYSPCSSPLDLSMNKGGSPLDLSINTGRQLQTLVSPEMKKVKSKKWMDSHVGQVFSPARRALQKNRGISETDLCKEILNLYVSNADESGFEVLDETFNQSSLPAADISLNSSHRQEKDQSHNGGHSSGDEAPSLQYGTYVAPRHVVKETNVDDFTTKTVWKCYTGEAKTRKLQGGDGSLLCGDEHRLTALHLPVGHKRSSRQHSDSFNASFNSSHNSSLQLNSTLNESLNASQCERSFLEESLNSSTNSEKHKSTKSRALRDKTNTTRRLSTLKLPAPARRDESFDLGSLDDEIQENSKPVNMGEQSFDRLTMLHTARNGKRRVRCLTLDESQSVVKDFPPPKEASRVSWGQTISEMDLYRHTPRKTPVKTRPILNQKENLYPYEDDTPSPIVLTKMRKQKSLSKRFKNWPWS